MQHNHIPIYVRIDARQKQPTILEALMKTNPVDPAPV